MNRFVIILPFALPDVANMLTIHLANRGFAYWHWGNDSWLLATTDWSVDAIQVREIVGQVLMPGIAYLVLRVELPQSGISWAWNGALGNTAGWTEWLRQYWEVKS
jgi:hypothetical protein